jgi:hypothetical protein
MIKFINDLLTEDDGLSYCWARVMSSAGVITYIGSVGYMLWKTGSIDLSGFATGFSTLLAGAGAAIALKASTQKTIKPE